MSGSGGSGGGFSAPESSCEELVIDTQISSPKPDVIGSIAVGDVLEVAITRSGATATIVVKRDGEVAGGLAAPLVQRLRQCIEAGTQYNARVTSRTDALIRVRVSAITMAAA